MFSRSDVGRVKESHIELHHEQISSIISELQHGDGEEVIVKVATGARGVAKQLKQHVVPNSRSQIEIKMVPKSGFEMCFTPSTEGAGGPKHVSNRKPVLKIDHVCSEGRGFSHVGL